MKYYIIREENVKILEENVNESLFEGWELRGNLIVDRKSNGDVWYLQVMTKEE